MPAYFMKQSLFALKTASMSPLIDSAVVLGGVATAQTISQLDKLRYSFRRELKLNDLGLDLEIGLEKRFRHSTTAWREDPNPLLTCPSFHESSRN